MQGAHGLERDDAGALGGGEDLARLAGVGAEGLLHEHVLAAGYAGESLLMVERVGAPNVDRVDLVAAGKVLERGEGVGPAVLGGEGLGASGVAGEGARKDSAVKASARAASRERVPAKMAPGVEAMASIRLRVMALVPMVAMRIMAGVLSLAGAWGWPRCRDRTRGP